MVQIYILHKHFMNSCLPEVYITFGKSTELETPGILHSLQELPLTTIYSFHEN